MLLIVISKALISFDNKDTNALNAEKKCDSKV